MTGPTFSKAEALRYGWRTMKGKLGLFVGASIVTAAVTLATSGLGELFAPYGALRALAGLVGQVVQAWLAMGWIRIALEVHDRGDASLRAFPVRGGDLAPFLGYLATSILYALIVAVGLILFVVPGIYWAVRLSMAGFLVVDRGLEPLEALHRSSVVTEGARLRLFVFLLLCIGLNVLGALALGVGLLFTIPATAMAIAFVYRRLEAQARVSAPPGTPQAVPA